MFDRIAPTYDFLNRVLSAGIDRGWRARLAGALPQTPERLDILDLATGTGDQLFAIAKARPERIASITGADPSAGMLALAAKKSSAGDPNPRWVLCEAGPLPFNDATFDAVSMSFGIRNVPDPLDTLREIVRVLRPGGRALILEFSMPRSAFVRTPYLFYFRRVLPWIGGIFSGDRTAYRYLNQTVEEFPCGPAFEEWMLRAGFEKVSGSPLTFGIATLYQGDKPA